MKILRALAIDDLSLKFAEKVSDKEINVYRMSATLTEIGMKKIDVKGTLESFLCDDVQVIDTPYSQHCSDSPFYVEPVNKLIEDIKLRELIEREAKKNKRDHVLIRKVVFKDRIGKTLHKLYNFVFGEQYNALVIKKKTIKQILFNFLLKLDHKIEICRVAYFGVLASNETQKMAVNALAKIVEQEIKNIHGFMSPGIIEVKLADFVGDGKQRSVFLVYVHLKESDYSKITSRYRDMFLLEGTVPKALYDSDDSKSINRNIIDIPKNKIVFIEEKDTKE